jgi:hypothetical protein
MKNAVLIWVSILLLVLLIVGLWFTHAGTAIFKRQRHQNMEDLKSFAKQIAEQQNPGPFDRDYFESVVKHVRARGLKPGEKKGFSVDDLAKAPSPDAIKLKRDFRSGPGAGTIWAEMTVEGKLKVVIMTRDLGHAGEYGFAYSEAPLKPIPLGGGSWLRLDLPGHLNIVLPDMKIDENWWQVIYNLD